MFVGEDRSSSSREASAGKRQRAGALATAAAADVGFFLLSSVVLSGKFGRSGFLLFFVVG